MDNAWTRPRYNGYLAFQERAGEMIESHLRGMIDENALLIALRRLHAEG